MDQSSSNEESKVRIERMLRNGELIEAGMLNDNLRRIIAGLECRNRMFICKDYMKQQVIEAQESIIASIELILVKTEEGFESEREQKKKLQAQLANHQFLNPGGPIDLWGKGQRKSIAPTGSKIVKKITSGCSLAPIREEVAEGSQHQGIEGSERRLNVGCLHMGGQPGTETKLDGGAGRRSTILVDPSRQTFGKSSPLTILQQNDLNIQLERANMLKRLYIDTKTSLKNLHSSFDTFQTNTNQLLNKQNVLCNLHIAKLKVLIYIIIIIIILNLYIF